MSDRKYTGNPLDMSWQDIKDRPYKGTGETVGVVGGDEKTKDGYVDVPEDFYLVESQFDVFKKIAENEPTTPSKVSDQTGLTKQTIRNVAKKLENHSLVERDLESGEIRTVVSLGDRFRFTDRITSDVLVSDTHPFRIPPAARDILAYAAVNPTKTQVAIAEDMARPRSQVNETLNEYGDPRREIEAISVGYAKSELKLVESRIESLKERRSELKQKINSGGLGSD